VNHPPDAKTHPNQCLRNFTHTSSFVRVSTTPPLSVAQASDEKRIPKRTIQAAIARGELKAHKMPGATGAYLISPRDLDRWVAKREAKAGAA
jgi:excisionase family DNA binding protein